MKQLDNSHTDLALSYLSAEPEFNLFLTGDIANCGMKSDLVMQRQWLIFYPLRLCTISAENKIS